MNESLRTLLAALTLGLSEAIMAIVKASKCPNEYVYTPKKNGCCKHRKRCALWKFCMEDLDSCRSTHLEYEDTIKC